MEKIRVFIAIDVSDETITKKLVDIRRILNEKAKIKFVEDNNLHLTLKFLGEIENEKLALAKEELNNVKFKPFKIVLKGIGCFKPNYPRVIWVGVSEGKNDVIKLAEKIDEKLRKIGFKPETKKTPHLTIGRVKYLKNRIDLLKKIDEMKNLEFTEKNVTSFKLKKSTLTPHGPIYETIQEYNMGD